MGRFVVSARVDDRSARDSPDVTDVRRDAECLAVRVEVEENGSPTVGPVACEYGE